MHVSGIPSSTSQFEVSKNNADDNVDYWLQSKLTGAKWQMTLHRIAVRYGVEPDLIFGRQVITLSVEAANDRIAMAAIPLSFVAGQ